VAPPEVEGRAFDYPVAYNLTQRPRAYEALDFPTLRALADNYDLMRLVLETRKDQVESYEWEIVAKEGKSVSDSDIEKANEFFLYPDKEHVWNTWLRMLLEDLFVIDAMCVYPRATRGGELYALELIDGGSIKRVLDPTGRTPLPPDPAYQQVLKGLPAVDYTNEELIYTMRNPRSNRIYGLSPVEQVVMTVNIAMRRQMHQLQFYTEGSVPEAICGVPETWNMETLRQFQVYWDSMMEGDTAQRRKFKFVPWDPSKASFPKADVLKDEFDEWLARIICFAFSISPSALIKQTNRATATSVQEAALKEGLVPLLNWLKRFFDLLITRCYGNSNLEFTWQLQKDLDPLVQAQVDQIYLATKVILPEEVRERIGLAELTPEQDAKLNPPPPEPGAMTMKPGDSLVHPQSGEVLATAPTPPTKEPTPTKSGGQKTKAGNKQADNATEKVEA
jgi:hypothetical protein